MLLTNDCLSTKLDYFPRTNPAVRIKASSYQHLNEKRKEANLTTVEWTNKDHSLTKIYFIIRQMASFVTKK